MNEPQKTLSNVQRLIIHKMTLILVPAGGGIGAAITGLVNPDARKAAITAATDWVNQAIAVVKTAPDNPFRDDEAIAGEILRQVELKKQAAR